MKPANMRKFARFCLFMAEVFWWVSIIDLLHSIIFCLPNPYCTQITLHAAFGYSAALGILLALINRVKKAEAERHKSINT